MRYGLCCLVLLLCSPAGATPPRRYQQGDCERIAAHRPLQERYLESLEKGKANLMRPVPNPSDFYLADRNRQLAQREESIAKAREGLLRIDSDVQACQDGLKAQVDQEAAERKLKQDASEQAERDGAARAARVAAHRADAKYVRRLVSAQYCAGLQWRQAAIDEIRKAKQNARETGGGIVDLHDIYQYQQEAAAGKEAADLALAELKRDHTKPLPCTDYTVAVLATCVSEDPDASKDEQCSAPAFAEYLELLQQ